MDPDLRFTARRKYAVAMALGEFDPRSPDELLAYFRRGIPPEIPTLRGQATTLYMSSNTPMGPRPGELITQS